MRGLCGCVNGGTFGTLVFTLKRGNRGIAPIGRRVCLWHVFVLLMRLTRCNRLDGYVRLSLLVNVLYFVRIVPKWMNIGGRVNSRLVRRLDDLDGYILFSRFVIRKRLVLNLNLRKLFDRVIRLKRRKLRRNRMLLLLIRTRMWMRLVLLVMSLKFLRMSPTRVLV